MPVRLRRLILWDVDGTLLWAGGATREAFDAAVGDVLGRHPGHHGVSFSGKTDPRIALEIMEAAGVPEPDGRRMLPSVLTALEVETAAAAGRMRDQGHAHPGVAEVLARLAARPDVLQSVLTGNLGPNARVKVAAFGLDRWLDLEVGAFGSDHADRDELVPVALRRVHDRYGWRPGPGQTWVVGDTPHDLACARAGGARCLLVGTGHIALADLSSIGADQVLADLGDVDEVVAVLTS